MRDGEKLAGEAPVLAGKAARPPRKILDAPVKFPEQPAGTVGSGVWIGEVLIGRDGKVLRVWPIREVRFTPPFPSFNAAIVDAAKRSVYEPVTVDSRAVPFCMTMTVNINWR